jgi:hypothetical protein
MQRIATRRIVGIDFSGGVNAGRKIWIACGRVENSALLIDTCLRGEALPDSSRDRTACLAALRAFIRSSGDALIGLDFPLSLPRDLLDNQTWLQFIHAFAARFATPQQFRQACFTAAHGRELKRRTDLEAKTPFSPYNLRLYRQTYYGLRDVIAPLVDDRSVRVLPLQNDRSGLPSLIEICPASTLKRLNLYQPYKGNSIERYYARASIWRSLQHKGIKLASRLKPIVLADPEGDALDSLIAAWATYQAQHLIEQRTDRAAHEYRCEGYVYA